MSSGQALAAAQRRRAGGAKNAPAAPPRQTQTPVRTSSKPPVSLEELVSTHDRQLFDVGRYIVSNDEHWVLVRLSGPVICIWSGPVVWSGYSLTVAIPLSGYNLTYKPNTIGIR